MTEIIQNDRDRADAMLSDLCAPMTDLAGEAVAAHFAAYRRSLYEPTPERVERVARAMGEAKRKRCGGYPYSGDNPALDPWFDDELVIQARAAIAAMGE